jgi:hypothetical protein
MNGAAARSKCLELLLEERIMLMPVLGYGKVGADEAVPVCL